MFHTRLFIFSGKNPFNVLNPFSKGLGILMKHVPFCRIGIASSANTENFLKISGCKWNKWAPVTPIISMISKKPQTVDRSSSIIIISPNIEPTRTISENLYLLMSYDVARIMVTQGRLSFSGRGIWRIILEKYKKGRRRRNKKILNWEFNLKPGNHFLFSKK